MSDLDSVFHYYQKLIALRKKYALIVYGKYEMLFEDDENLFVYTREMKGEKLLTVCNFTDQQQEFDLPNEFQNAVCLIANLPNVYAQRKILLKPYEAFVLYKK